MWQAVYELAAILTFNVGTLKESRLTSKPRNGSPPVLSIISMIVGTQQIAAENTETFKNANIRALFESL